MDAYIAMIVLFGFDWAPRAWARCDGQLLSISQNTALFSLIGATYGGDGKTNFALPDLRGRAPIHSGQGNGLTPRAMGESSGTETNTLATAQLASHTHGVSVSAGLHGETALADKRNPLGAMLATPPLGAPIYADPVPAEDKLMAADSLKITVDIQPTGSNQPVNNMQPFLAMNYCICLQGIFPSRP